MTTKSIKEITPAGADTLLLQRIHGVVQYPRRPFPVERFVGKGCCVGGNLEGTTLLAPFIEGGGYSTLATLLGHPLPSLFTEEVRNALLHPGAEPTVLGA
jgi:hypothetical protein